MPSPWAADENKSNHNLMDERAQMDFGNFRPPSFFTLVYLFLAPALVLVTSQSTHAQELPWLKGTVRDTQTGEPLPGANIVVKGTRIGTATDVDGHFEFAALPLGQATLVVSFVGYHTQARTLEVKPPNVISGKIVDDRSGRSLAGIRVTLKDTPRSSVTDSAGGYLFENVPAGVFTLEVSTEGYQPLVSTVTVGPQKIDVDLRPDIFRGEEVVVTGIASKTSRSVAEVAVARLPASEYTVKQNYRTTSQLINGKVAGVQVKKASGNVGSGFRFDMRAGGGLNGDEQPVIFIDGIRVENTEVLGFEVGGQGISLLSEISPEEIKTIEILKGPAGAASYGTNGANGVVLITTKRGQYAGGSENPMSLNYQFSTGVNTQSYRYKSSDYLSAAAANDIFRTGSIIQNSLNASGGSGSLRYFAAFDSRVEDGILAPNRLDRKNLRANFDVTPNDRFTFSVSTSYTNSKIRRPANDNNSFGYLVNTTIDPTPFQFVGGGRSAIENIADDNKSNRFLGSFTAVYKPSPFVTSKLALGIDDHDLRQDQTYPVNETYSDAIFNAGVRNLFTRRSRLLTYHFDTRVQASLRPELDMSVTAGLQLFDRKLNTFSTQRYDFLIPFVTAIDAGAEDSFVEETSDQSREAGIFGTATLAYRNRYFLSLKLRRDYATAIGRNAASIFYPGVSAALRLDRFNIFPASFNLLKFRTAYGETGILPNPLDALPLTFRPESGGYGVGGVPASIGNSAIKPERVKEFEIGFDTEIMHDYAVEFTYYRQTASQSIFAFTDSPSTGLTSTPKPINAGSSKGWGIESMLQAGLLHQRRVDLSLTLLSSWQHNEVTDIGDAVPIFDSFGLNVIKPGLAKHEFFLEPVFGPLFNDDGTYAGPDFGDERVARGNPTPTYTGSFSFDLRLFRNLNIYLLTDWATGHKIWNGGKSLAFLAGNNPRYNLLASQLGIAGTSNADGVAENVDPVKGVVPFTPGTAEYQAAAAEFAHLDPFLDANFLEDADFIKLRELSVSYSFKDLLARTFRRGRSLKDLTLTFSATNLLTLTKYSGPEVEVNWSGARALERGQDYFTLQSPRSYNFSFRLSF